MPNNEMNDLWKTRSFISAMTLSANGWQRGQYDPEACLEPMNHLYVHDPLTNWTWACAVVRESFVKLSTHASKNTKAWDSNRGAVGTLITGVAAGNPPEPVNGHNWEYQLGFLLSFYAGTTETWKRADGFREGGHFFVLCYRGNKSALPMLRPFGLPGHSNHLLPTTELKSVIKDVTAADLKRHPEWFR